MNARSEKSDGLLPAGEQSVSFQETTLIHENGRPISETRITMADRVLIVGLEANYFSSRIKTLKKEMVVFVTILILFGGMSSLWLYRVQRHQLHQARQFERKMARQKEQAALGRAAATITHEIRNPLNAISMGLQRLQMETGDLAPDHLALIGGMREAVSRTNAIISNLQQYVRPFTCECQPVAAADLISTLLAPYRQTCSSRNIAIDLNLDSTLMWNVDRHLLGQAKLLRTLQENKITRVGSETDIPVDIRVLAATNRDLKKLIDRGGFREDLYFRLNVLELIIPPLRERREDIPELIDHFLKKYAGRPMSFDADALNQVVKYAFPGNVRELEHLIQRLITLVRGSVIRWDDLPSAVREKLSDTGLLEERLADLEKSMLVSALKDNEWIQTRAAESLGISERVLRYKMKKAGIASPGKQ